MNSPRVKQIILGDEFDEGLRLRVVEALEAMGATFEASSIGVAGSQELETMRAWIGMQMIVLEAETYVGLSVSGPEELVERIRQAIAV